MRLEVKDHPFWHHVMHTFPGMDKDYHKQYCLHMSDLAESATMGPSSEIIAFLESVIKSGVLDEKQHTRFRSYDLQIASWINHFNWLEAQYYYAELCAYGQDVLDVLERG